MLYINEQRIGGHLGKDAEIRPNPKTDRGWFVILRVATTKRWKDANGAKREATTWHDVELYTTSEGYRDYLRDRAVKGALVYVVGETIHDEFVGADGHNRQRTLVRCESLQIISAPPEREDSRPAPAAAATPLRAPATPTPTPAPAPSTYAQLGPAPRDMDFGT
jgi:single-strand DNA-binding protein